MFLLAVLHHMLFCSAWAETAALQERIPLKIGVEAQVIRPAHAWGGGKFPVILVFGGFEEAARVLTLVKTSAPVILASFDYPYSGPRKLGVFKALLEAQKLKKSIGVTFEGIQELIEILKNRPDVDASRIWILGASFGAPFAIAAAARIPDIQTLILIHGFGEIDAAIAHRLTQIWRPKIGFAAPFAAWVSAWVAVGYLSPPDPVKEIKKLRFDQKVLSIEAEDDQFIPKRSRSALRTALKSSIAQVTLYVMPGDHLQPSADEQIREITRIVEKWFYLEKLL